MSDKPLGKVMLWILALPACAGMLFGIWGWASESRLHRRLAELRDQGIPVAIADLDAQSAHDGRQAVELVRALNRELRGVDPNWQDLCSSEIMGEGGTPLAEEVSARMRAIAENARARELLRQLAELPGHELYAAPGEQGDLMERFIDVMGDIRGVYRYLSVSAHFYRSTGAADRAMDDVLAAARTLRRGGPCLVGHLLRVACLNIVVFEAAETLSAGTFGKETLDALDARLAELDVHQWWREAVLSERAYGLDQFERHLAFARYWPIRPMYNNTLAYYLDTLDYYQHYGLNTPDTATAKPPHKGFSVWNRLVDLVIPAVQASQDASRTGIARIRSLRVQLRIVKQAAEQGAPTEVAWESIDLPAEEKTDPFSGKPLLIRRTDSGWVVYSVGKNLQDDGGKLDDQSDVGVRITFSR